MGRVLLGYIMEWKWGIKGGWGCYGRHIMGVTVSGRASAIHIMGVITSRRTSTTHIMGTITSGGTF